MTVKARVALSLRGRLFLLALLPLLASLALIAFAVRQQERELAAREQALVRASYMDARRTELKHYVDLAASTIRPLLARPDPRRERVADWPRREPSRHARRSRVSTTSSVEDAAAQVVDTRAKAWA